MGAKTEPDRPFLEQKIAATAIGRSEEDGIASIATQQDVAMRTGIIDSGFAWHRLRREDNIYLSNLPPKTKTLC